MAVIVHMRGPLRLAVTSAPGMPSSWKDCTGVLTSEAFHITLDSGRRSSVTALTDSTTLDATFPAVIPTKDLESLEDIPISIATRGRHALCLKCHNSKGAYEKHFSFSSESQFLTWRSSLSAAIQSSSHASADFDYFAPPPVEIALPPPPQQPDGIDSARQYEGLESSNDLNMTKFSFAASSARVENVGELIENSLHDSSSTMQPQLLHSNLKVSSRDSFSHPSLEHVDSFDDYPTILPLMNALLSADGFAAPLSTRNVPATVAANLLRLNARAVAAASVETKFETDTLVSSLKQSIHHLQTSKDELFQELESLKELSRQSKSSQQAEFESFKELSRQSISSQQALLEEKDEKISIQNSQLRQIFRVCGLETEDPAKIIEFISALQEKFSLQSTATFMLQSEIEFTRQSGTRAAALHASIVETKDSEIGNLACALENKNSEIENLTACLQALAEKVKIYELANSRIREDTLRHQTESDARVSMFQHNIEMKIRGLSSERDALILENASLVQDFQAKCSEVDNLLSSLQRQSDVIQSKNSEAENLMCHLHEKADTIKDLELSIARIGEEARRTQKEAEMRMVMYQHNAEMKIQVLSSERDMLQSNIHSDAETLKRFRDKYVAALADNSLLLETIRILNNSIAQMQVQICELESKLDSKDLEISSGKSSLQELIRETDVNRQLLHSAMDLHNQSVFSRSVDVKQVDIRMHSFSDSSVASVMHNFCPYLTLTHATDKASGQRKYGFPSSR